MHSLEYTQKYKESFAFSNRCGSNTDTDNGPFTWMRRMTVYSGKYSGEYKQKCKRALHLHRDVGVICTHERERDMWDTQRHETDMDAETLVYTET